MHVPTRYWRLRASLWSSRSVLVHGWCAGSWLMAIAFPGAVPLRRANLEKLPNWVSTPRYDAAQLSPAIVHLGVGAFHRAHQAVYLDRLAEAGERGWGIVGAGLRSGRLASSLVPQEGLYTVVERGPGAQ